MNHIVKISEITLFFNDDPKLIQRGENALESNHVFTAIFDKELKMIKGTILASMKKKTYKVEVAFDDMWHITSAFCECPRGLVRCHHMATLLLFAHYNYSATDTSCKWSAPKGNKDDDTKTMSDLYPPPKPYKATISNLTDSVVEQFKNKLSVFEESVGFGWLLSDSSDLNEEIINIEDIIFSDEFAKRDVTYFKERVTLTQQQILLIAEATIGQSSNYRWLMWRKNRLTASNFGIVLKACARNRFPPSLFKTLTNAYNLDNVKSIQWGRDHEQDGIEAFERTFNKKIEKTGIWLHECGFLGASPDGLINEDALVEIKCPYKYRSTSILQDITNSKTYIVYVNEDGSVEINKEHIYYIQIQGMLSITKRSLCYLVIWTPIDVLITKIEAEDFNSKINILQTFYINHYLQFLCSENKENVNC